MWRQSTRTAASSWHQMTRVVLWGTNDWNATRNRNPTSLPCRWEVWPGPNSRHSMSLYKLTKKQSIWWRWNLHHLFFQRFFPSSDIFRTWRLRQRTVWELIGFDPVHEVRPAPRPGLDPAWVVSHCRWREEVSIRQPLRLLPCGTLSGSGPM